MTEIETLCDWLRSEEGQGRLEKSKAILRDEKVRLEV